MKILSTTMRFKKNLVQSKVFAVLLLSVLLACGVLFRRIPSASELSFSERSLISSRFGAVLPASCDSAPPTGHFNGDCDPLINLGVGGDLSSFVDITFTTSTTTAAYQEKPQLTWTTAGYTGCTLSQVVGGATTTLTSGLSQNNYTPTYENRSGSRQIVLFSLRCVNAPHKDDTKAVRVWYETLPLVPCPDFIVAGGYVLNLNSSYPAQTVLPNGHPFCGYLGSGGGDPHWGAFDMVLGRKIMFGSVIQSGNVWTQDVDGGAISSAGSGAYAVQLAEYTMRDDNDCPDWGPQGDAVYYVARSHCADRWWAAVVDPSHLDQIVAAHGYPPQSSLTPDGLLNYWCIFSAGWDNSYCYMTSSLWWTPPPAP